MVLSPVSSRQQCFRMISEGLHMVTCAVHLIPRGGGPLVPLAFKLFHGLRLSSYGMRVISYWLHTVLCFVFVCGWFPFVAAPNCFFSQVTWWRA